MSLALSACTSCGLAFLALFTALCTACSGGEGDVILARDRAADRAVREGEDHWIEARELLRPLAERDDAPLEDILRMANAELAIVGKNDQIERAWPLLERAAKLDPDHPVLLWCRYHVARIQNELEAALVLLRRLQALRPDDFIVKLALAQVLEDLERPELLKESEVLYRELLSIPQEYTGAWRRTMAYRLALQLSRQGRDQEAMPLWTEVKTLEAAKVEAPKDPFHSPGTLGAVPPHTLTLFDVRAPKPFEPRLVHEELDGEGALGAAPVHLGWGADIVDIGTDREETFSTRAASSVVAWGSIGVALVRGEGAPQTLLSTPVLDLVAFDRMNHGVDRSNDPVQDRKKGDRDLDFLVVTADGEQSVLRLLENVEGKWSVREAPLATLPPIDGPGSLLALDFDHEGDVDLLVSTSEGLRLLRNDGLDQNGGFTDATVEAGLPRGRFRAISEDLDHDDDVDFLLIERDSGSPRFASNLRGGGFSDESGSLPAGLAGRWIVPADFDGNSRVDLAVFGQDLGLYMRDDLGGWRSEVKHLPLHPAPTGEPQAVDWDLDGTFDLLWPCAEVPAAGLLAPGFSTGGVAITLGEGSPSTVEGPVTLRVADLDDDHDLDLLRLDASGLHAYLAEGKGRSTLLALQGYKSNSRGVGAVLEVRSGFVYRRIYYRGEPELIGFGGKTLDVAAITWPNGIWQGNFGIAPGAERIIAERPGLPGSCPFLYTWNGTTYEFVSDVLGITPLGLPMAPGMMVPPDHDEYVLVRGNQLVPKDGVYEMHFTEELREVTYLDRIRLDVVDHPSDVEVFPNERFSFPPFPEPHTHTVRDALPPKSAVDQDGKDWTEELTRDDKRFAVPFEPLNGPYRGLATPHTLELAFDRERVQHAPKLRLFLNGWFYWTDASVNMAVARHPDYEFIPPILSVPDGPDGNGGWKELGPIGFPAGKLKTMAVDVSELVNRDDPRIRLFSTLRLYWDSIRLAVDADDAPVVTTSLEPLSADLWQRGFSRAHMLPGEHELEWFTWGEIEELPRWNQHPGLYTKLGETRTLVSAIDDRFVILGAGDALTVRFDARQAPALLPGWKRDFLVFLDGWAKDRDPNTLEALYVEPLPFHGMSGYPYRPDEHYPDDEAHRAYRREWNTRPATHWIESSVPPRLGGRSPSTTTSGAPSD